MRFLYDYNTGIHFLFRFTNCSIYYPCISFCFTLFFLLCAYCTSFLMFFVMHLHIYFIHAFILLFIRYFHNTSMYGRASTLLFLLFLQSAIHTKQKKTDPFGSAFCSCFQLRYFSAISSSTSISFSEMFFTRFSATV